MLFTDGLKHSASEPIPPRSAVGWHTARKTMAISHHHTAVGLLPGYCHNNSKHDTYTSWSLSPSDPLPSMATPPSPYPIGQPIPAPLAGLPLVGHRSQADLQPPFRGHETRYTQSAATRTTHMTRTSNFLPSVRPSRSGGCCRTRSLQYSMGEGGSEGLGRPSVHPTPTEDSIGGQRSRTRRPPGHWVG